MSEEDVCIDHEICYNFKHDVDCIVQCKNAKGYNRWYTDEHCICSNRVEQTGDIFNGDANCLYE